MQKIEDSPFELGPEPNSCPDRRLAKPANQLLVDNFIQWIHPADET